MGNGPGQQGGGAGYYPADQHDLESYARAEAGLARQRVPVLLHADNPHERLFVAGLDGTGNSMQDDPQERWSVVASIHQQIDALQKQGQTRIAGGYVEGVFTQSGLLKQPEKLVDGVFGTSFDERVETVYYQLCVQAEKWLSEDPQAQIRVAGVGFSRGAEEVPALLRMIDERGIRDPEGADYKINDENLITHIRYADRPLLVEPNQTLQAALLYDPVSTGIQRYDRRLPDSSMSAFQIVAEDEKRNAFEASNQIPPGYSEDNRNYSVTVGGAHSDIGNTYARKGLGTMSLNLGISFLNRLSDQDYLQKQPLPQELSQYVVHRSEQHMMGLYRTSRYDRDGVREHEDRLAPASVCRDEPADCHRKDPIDPTLEQDLERRTVPATGNSELGGFLERLYQGALNRDDKAMSEAVADYMHSPDSLAFREQVAREQEQLQLREQQQWLEAQQAQAVRNAHVMRM